MSTTSPLTARGISPMRTRLLGSYTPDPSSYDELLAPDGTVRPPWRGFIDGLCKMGDADRARAMDTASRMLRENGVTYIAGDGPEPTARPWQLDLFPVIIGQSEWQELETGLIQRANLLNSILVDLYGAQSLLREGGLPPAIVFGNPQFLRPCHGIDVAGDMHLHFLAFDLVRARDGRWWVIHDRTQSPSGAGFALENRIVASRCLPALFEQQNVHRLASFFHAFSQHFLSLSRRNEPQAVVLSSGPGKETYFEHAYLARYLGYTLVEGSDLTVRDNRVFLKTVEGLKPVDLILRRIDSEMCDPLELRTDSVIGIPGLVQAARDGSVVIANALGSGLAENEALLSFLPGLSKKLLNEELKIPSVASWWCGQPKEAQYVIDNLDTLVVRKIYSRKTIMTPGTDSVVGRDLTPAQRTALKQAIERRGHEYIGQEMLTLSSTGVWSEDGGLEPAPMTLRVYVAATENGYRVMPGGLARVSMTRDPRQAWLDTGDISKDTWIVSDAPVDTFSLLTQPHHRLRLTRGIHDLPSRAADNMFWLGRYTERLEGAARLMRSLIMSLSGEPGAGRDPVTPERLIALLVVQEHLSPRRGKKTLEEGMRGIENELWTLLFDPDSPDGLSKVLGNVRRTAGLVRERLSFDTWQILTELTEAPTNWQLGTGQELNDASRLLNRTIQYLAAFNGMVMENMTHGHGWRFLDMGRRIERIGFSTRLIRELTARNDRSLRGALELLLELADSTMTYRTRYKATPQLPAALDLVLSDETNPRSVLYQLQAIGNHLANIPMPDDEQMLNPVQRVILRLTTELRLADMWVLTEATKRSGARTNLDRMNKQILSGIEEVADVIARTYFIHSMPTHVTGPHWTETET